ncbi:hypothetical protein F5878DRAFT_627250 [Lentinula raphanica]|uniref:Uncharacterized protein n=1 Tax=Lentinula raphanica TaxID=153919 RepID=A0AA38P3P8_9AGAR|nr:hypothetical protein F5878DRAFT_627250 [Lentinula raphanica]
MFRGNIMQLIINESHSASEWGENFRPDYAELGKLLARLRNFPVDFRSFSPLPQEIQDFFRIWVLLNL